MKAARNVTKAIHYSDVALCNVRTLSKWGQKPLNIALYELIQSLIEMQKLRAFCDT